MEMKTWWVMDIELEMVMVVEMDIGVDMG